MLLSTASEIWSIGEPSRILLLAIVMAACVSVVASGAARILSVMVAMALIFVAIAPFGYWLLIPLEARFPAHNSIFPTSPYGIIALGGDSGHRLAALAQLSQRFPDALLVYSGPGDPVAAVNQLRQGHLDPAHVIVESRSRSTAENAEDSAHLVKPQADQLWLLVTSAAHMPRAIGCFRAAGFHVVAYPVDFITRNEGPPGYGGRGPAPLGERRLAQLDDAVKEWIGLVAYRIVGSTSALFPAP